MTIGSGRTWTVTGGTLLNASSPAVGIVEGPGGLNVSTTTYTNSGIMRAASLAVAGSMALTGNYNQSGATSGLNVKLGGTTVGTQYDRVAISGTATLGGPLNVSLFNGFSSTAGNTFVIMTYTGLPVGNFTSFNLPAGCSANPISGQYQIVCI